MSSKDQIQGVGKDGWNEEMLSEEETLSTNEPLSPDITTVASTSTDNNESSNCMEFKSPTKEFFEERKLMLSKLKNIEMKTNALDSVLQKYDNDNEYKLTDDELDHIQWELESLISSAIVRNSIIKNEHHSLVAFQLGTPLPSLSDYPELNAIRSEAADTENVLPENNFYMNESNFKENLPLIPSESACKFWSFVEPYLAHVTENDIKWLKDLIASYNQPLCAIPPLGKYYANNWAEKMLKVKKQSNSQPFTELSERVSPDVVELVNKINNIVCDENVSMAIYQNISAALFENSQKNVKENLSEGDLEDQPEELNNVYKEFCTVQDVTKQLEKLGLIGDHVQPDRSQTMGNFDSHDEILAELQKCDTELVQLQKINHSHLIDLLKRCRKDYDLEIINNKIKKLNNEILNFKEQNNMFGNGSKSIMKKKKKQKSLLKKRKKYIEKLKSYTSETSEDLNASVSNDSDSETFNEHIKLSSSNIGVKQNDVVDSESD